MADVRVGQLWKDGDPRIAQLGRGDRLIRVTLVGSTHAQVETWYDGEIGKTSRTSRVRLDRFKPRSTGYRLVEEAPDA